MFWRAAIFAFISSVAAVLAADAETESETETEQVIVSVARLPDAESAAPFDVHVIESDDLRRAPQLRLDDVLRAEVPGFSLFRRSSSRTANPTTQGVTLRNFGPSGAGRTLVLLDGIPLNDPFAGYVLWSQVPPGALESVLVQPGGGAGLFGNAALAGTIHLVSRALQETAAAGEVSIGERETYELSLDAAIVDRPVAFAIYADRFSTGGYPVARAGQRGPVDTDATSESNVIGLRGEWQITRDSSLRVQSRWFNDDRGNGTRYTRNASRGADLSATVTHNFSTSGAELQLSAYLQDRNFSSTFSSINATRDLETPALNQFDVPATAVGASAVWSMPLGAQHRLTTGADLRSIAGETNEAYLWNGAEYTRLREAGGRQLFVGAFAEDTWSVTRVLTIVGGFRYDHWELFDGFRRESERATGRLRLDSRFNDRSGDEANGRLGIRLNVTPTIALRAAGYTGFRLPTLNELYRPFRVGNDVTEANPSLQPEHLIGGEAGVDWQATRTLKFTAAAFCNRMENAVGNVTIGVGPGTFDPGGFIPAGGVLRQRQNIDLIVAPGFETKGEWQVLPAVSLRASYLFTRPTIERAADPALEGKLLAQTPEHVFSGGVAWTPFPRWQLHAQLRYSSRQFEDDQNSRVLAAFTTIDAAVGYELSTHGSVAVRVENLFDTEIETGRSATGLVSIGAPRLVSLQFRWQL